MNRTFRPAAALVLAVAFAACFSAAEAGQLRSPVPLRIGKVKVGDWVLYRDDNGFTRETATELEEVEGDYLVHYKMETYDTAGKLTQTDEVVRFRSGELQEYADLVRSKAKVSRERMTIGGKEATIYKAEIPEDPPYEMWFSDDFGITGSAGMKYTLATGEEGEMEDYFPIEVMAFGGERDKMDIRRSVRLVQDRERERQRREQELEKQREREMRAQEE